MDAALTLKPAISQTERLIFLDWVRIIAFAMLVFYHVGMYYVTWEFHIKSPHANNLLEPWMRLSSPWRMDLLFLVSGAATSFMLLRQGASGALLQQRARRLLIPLLFGMLVIVPPQSWLEVTQKLGYGGGYFDFMRLYLSGYKGFCFTPGRCLILPTWNHLWFLPYLFGYTLLLWCWLRWQPKLPDQLAAWFDTNVKSGLLLLLPILFLTLTRLLLRDQFPVTYALVDDWFSHSQYFAMFLLGAALARTQLVWPRMAQLRWMALLVALLAWGLLVQAQWLAQVANVPMRAISPVIYCVQQWCAIVAALGFAQTCLNQDSTARRYLTEAVFPVYILHQTLIILLAHGLAPLKLDVALEGGLIVLLTFMLSLAAFEAVRQVRWMRPLFGLQETRRVQLVNAPNPNGSPGLPRDPAQRSVEKAAKD